MRKKIAAVLVLVLVVSGAALLWLRASRVRPHPVVDGKIYRSGQLSPDQLAGVVRDHGIRTVMNLRGPNPHLSWYVEEKRAANRLGIVHLDFRFQSYDWPPQHEVRRFAAAISTAEQPLLMHCESGSDRSGWAAVVTRALEGDGLDASLRQLSRVKGHFCKPDECGLHQFFEEYRKWLAREDRKDSADEFRHWILDVYAPPPYDAAIDLVQPAPEFAQPGADLDFVIRVSNRSYVPWTTSGDSGIRLGARIIGPFPSPPTDPLALFRTPNGPARDVYRAPTPDGSLAPGATRNEPVRIHAPADPGHYVVQFDMVDERVHWFSDLGPPGLIVPLEIR